jgi:hypothetical protein
MITSTPYDLLNLIIYSALYEIDVFYQQIKYPLCTTSEKKIENYIYHYENFNSNWVSL